MEALSSIGGTQLAEIMGHFAAGLHAHKDRINRLNVYPVPDGDTGTNMSLTVMAVVKEIEQLRGSAVREVGSGSRPPSKQQKGEAEEPAGLQGRGRQRSDARLRGSASPEYLSAEPPSAGQDPQAGDGAPMLVGLSPTVAAVAKAVAHGSLMGARGNSGVILSQLLRGLGGILAEHEEPGAVELARGLRAASDAAQSAVLRPVEGTILTVARAAAEGAEAALGTVSASSSHSSADPGRGEKTAAGTATETCALLEVIVAAKRAAQEALAHTPEQLPVLARAGVVDAGGTGYLLLLDAFGCVVGGLAMPEPPEGEIYDKLPTGPIDRDVLLSGMAGVDALEDLRYEVMYLLDAPDETVPAFKEVWAGLGDSIVVVGGDGLWNCHIHTNQIGPAVEAGLDAGRPHGIRVTDLHEEVEEERWVREQGHQPEVMARFGPVPRTSVVAVANGAGVARIFHSLGASHLVAGGQSMNPSTEELLAVVEASDSPEVVILPNNGNIRPVAIAAGELSTKVVRVVPTESVVEGFAALLGYDPQASADEVAKEMTDSARRVISGEVTQAVRDADGSVGPISAGDWLGLDRDGIVAVSGSVAEACCELLARLLVDHHELVTLIEGEGARPADTRRITEWLDGQYPEIAVEVHDGGQPLYPYLFSIE